MSFICYRNPVQVGCATQTALDAPCKAGGDYFPAPACTQEGRSHTFLVPFTYNNFFCHNSRFFFFQPASKLVKDLGVQADNMFSSSAQCTEAANKARRLIFMIRITFQDLSKSTFIPLYGALVRPHLEYGMPAGSPNLVADINHL